MSNPFQFNEALNQVKEEILRERGQVIHQWNRIPAFKGSLVEISLNFVRGGNNPTVRDESIVPDGTIWHNLYDPDRRNEERFQDAISNDRDVNASVNDRPGLTLSANARLDTSHVNGNVTLGESFWDMLMAHGYRFISSYAQMKMQDETSRSADRQLIDEISSINREDGPGIADLLRELDYVEWRLSGHLHPKDRQKFDRQSAELRAELERYPRPRVRHLQSNLAPQKGWVRAYFAHESSPEYKEMQLIENVLKHCNLMDDDSSRTEADIRRLLGLQWGKMVVWNNPSTRTTRDHDLARQPKIAIQLMNSPKKDRPLKKLVCQEGFFQVA